MSKSRNTVSLVVALAFFFVVISCSNPEGNNPGTEYMPDMGHSIAYEANHYDYYSHNTWGTEDEYYKYAQPRQPIKGTIPIGYAGSNREVKNAGVPVNGKVPYHYEDTEEERTRATNEIQENPFPITKEGLEVGKNLYNINCGICHGEKGDGNGWLVDENNPNAAYPAQPAIFTTDEFVAASPGRYYHSIMWGKNVMGHYKDKLSYEERWQVIHYIRSLQAKDRKLAYNENENTLNAYGIPFFSVGHKAYEEEVATLEVPILSLHGGGHHDSSHDAGHGTSDGHEQGEHHSDGSHQEEGQHSGEGHSDSDHDH
ncbi:MAG: cytochrome c [Bacteroidota bacterium]